MIRFGLLALIWCLGGLVQGQSADSTRIPRFVVKTNLLPPVFLFKQAVDLGVEVKLNRRYMADLAVGAYTGFGVFAEYKGEKYEGIRWRVGMKQYIDKNLNYWGITYKHHNIENDQYKSFFRQGRQYSEIATFTRKIKTHGLMFKVGTSSYFGKQKWFLMDASVGVGLVYHTIRRVLPFSDAESSWNRPLYEWSPGTRFGLDFHIGVHIGFAKW